MLAALFWGAVIGLIIGITKLYFKEARMSESQKEAVTTVIKAPAQHNVIHDVLIANTQLIADKLLGILAYLLGNEDDHGILSIVFTEEYPKSDGGENVLSRFHPDSQSMVINLMGHFEMAQEKIGEENCRMNFWAYLWQQLIRTIWHETHHSHKFADASLIYSVDTSAEEFEADAEDYAKEMIIELAKRIDIEPPQIDEFPFFAAEVGETVEILLSMDKPSASEASQQLMLTEGLVYYEAAVDDKAELRIPTLREYFRMLADDGDKLWESPVTGMAGMVEQPLQTVIEPVKVDIEEPTPQSENSIIEEPVVNNVSPVAEKPNVANAAPVEVSPEDMDIPDLDDEGVTVNPYEESGGTMEEPVMTSVSAPITGAPATGPVAVQNVVTPAVTAAPAAQPVKQLTPHNMSVDQMKACLQTVLLRLYAHIFNKCGFTPGVDHGFQNAAAVLEPCYIGDIPGANQLFVAMDTVVNGQKVLDAPIDGHITGRLFKEGQLPGYHFYLNINGMKEKRSFLPQNPNKTGADQQLTKWAQLARTGNMIAMMLQEGAGVRVKISTAPGGQTMYEFDPFAGR